MNNNENQFGNNNMSSSDNQLNTNNAVNSNIQTFGNENVQMNNNQYTNQFSVGGGQDNFVQQNVSQMNNFNNQIYDQNVQMVNENNQLPYKNVKKKRNIILGLSIGLAVVGVGSFVLFGNNNKKENLDNKNNVTEKKEEETLENDNKEKEDLVKEEKTKSGDYYFWKDTLKAGPQNNITYLFNDKFSLPLTKEGIKKYGKFRISGLMRVNGEMYENYEHTDFDTILKQTNYDNRMKKSYPWDRVKLYANEFDDEISITIENPNREETSVNDIFDKGYWYVTTSSIYTLYNSSFGIKNNDLKTWNADTKKYEFFDEIIKIFGSPSYVIAGEDFYTKTPYDSNSCSYHLIYEYDEYVIRISMHEMVFPDNNWVRSQVNELTYYPRNGWDSYYKDETSKAWSSSVIYLK